MTAPPSQASTVSPDTAALAVPLPRWYYRSHLADVHLGQSAGGRNGGRAAEIRLAEPARRASRGRPHRALARVRRSGRPARRHGGALEGPDACRARPERGGKDDAPAHPGHALATEPRRGLRARRLAPARGLAGAGPDRLSRARAASVSRPELRREPPLPGAALRASGRGRKASPGPPRRGRDVAPRRRAGRQSLRGDGATRGGLPRTAARAGAPAPRRAPLASRPRGGGAGRAAARA